MNPSFTATIDRLLRRTLVRSEIVIIKIKKSLIGFNYSLKHNAKIPPQVGMTSKSHQCFTAYNYSVLQPVNNLTCHPEARGICALWFEGCVQ
jgi:hypothetical protein